MRGPERYVQWINAHLGFNPRSQTNSNALSEYVIDDLCFASPKAIGELIRKGDLVPLKNASVSTGVSVRNIDLVLHEKSMLPQISVQLSVEHKTLMAAHGKARKNRYGDIIAYDNHMHNHRPDCVVGATVVINASPLYRNPDSFAKDLVRPDFDMEKVVKDTVKIFEAIPLRGSPDDPKELPEALAVIVVDYDGENPASLVTSDLSPSRTSETHYDNFIKRLVAKFEDRFVQ
jgi:hypothetical protein